jgi:hypothetical protein
MSRHDRTELFRRLLQGVVSSVAVVLLPAAGRIEALGHMKLWILIAVGAIAHVFQPAFNPVDKGAKREAASLHPTPSVPSLMARRIGSVFAAATSARRISVLGFGEVKNETLRARARRIARKYRAS